MNTIYTRSTRLQAFCWFFILLFTNQLFFPAVAVALTAGPSQPEVKSFEPVGTTEMVNLFSGDFTYNIPLLEVPGPDGGYPINLFYNSVTSMEQEATWTGLGWNINVGALSRSMRGLPDDFNGEKVGRKLDMRKNTTTTVGGLVSGEVAGFDFARIGFSLGINYVYNNYMGAGFSIDPNISLGLAVPLGFGYSPSFDFGLSVSTLEASSANVGFGIDNGIIGVRTGISFDAKGNHDYSLNIDTHRARLNSAKLSSQNINVSFAKRTYTPAISIPWTGKSFLWNATFNPGGAIAYAKFGLSGAYHEQYIEDGGYWKQESSYGYNFLQNAGGSNLLDFNREKDGVLHRNKRYLANPIMTHDAYSITGQGIGGSFRAHRSDYGFLFDPEVSSSTPGLTIGAEGGPLLEFGINASLIFRNETNSRWPFIDPISYKGENISAIYEPSYYKMAGEMTAEEAINYNYIGNGEARDKPLRLKRKGFNYDRSNQGELEAEKTISSTSWNNQGSYETKVQWDTDANSRSNRKPRSSSVQPISNKLLMAGGEEILPEFDIKYYKETHINNYDLNPSSGFFDVQRPSNDQNAAFTVMGEDGVRWNYGLPIYNNTQKTASFSVAPDTLSSRETLIPSKDNNTSRTEIDYIPSNDNLRSNDRIDEQHIPAYVHSHLLTSVLGVDYGDIDDIPGPSDGDVGYWMKTNYVKLSDDYQWRAPFVGANYARGYENSNKDDMAAFSWGSREVYLPATVETKTHIAFFKISKRHDARGANHYIQNPADLSSGEAYGAHSYKLDEITLYAKSDIKANGKSGATPLKTVHLKYDYSLCNGVDNYEVGPTLASDVDLWGAPNPVMGGKLTLKSVHFTYEKNERGALSPYVFDYNSLNPDYNPEKIDRWGIYRSQYLRAVYDDRDNINLPYTKQGVANKDLLDTDVAAWHLKEIKTPSGATISLEMERDDYGYVQDAQATRMVNISSMAAGAQGNNTIDNSPLPQTISNVGQRTIQFELENPTTDQQELERYLADLPEVERDGVRYKQLHYKIRVNLRNFDNITWEYVSGYCEIEKNAGDDLIYFEPSSVDGSGNYTRANIVLKSSRIRIDGVGHHPMAVWSWKFLKDNLPDKIIEQDLGGPPEAMLSLDQITGSIDQIFTGFYKYCINKDFATKIDLSHSYIRLNSPDGIQYGDGIRVKSITMDDNWAVTSSQTSTMGVAYDYTTTTADGRAYSSGVLENEVTIGYEECPLRWAVPQEEHKDGVVRDIHLYEYPMNEGYYPGARVGYSKVAVRSLASDYALKKSKGESIPSDLSGNYSTTGQTVYEYYTAKDFPIITTKTGLDDTETNPWATALLDTWLSVRLDHYTGTQGYCIEMSNMHGRERKVATYGQSTTGSVNPEALTSVEYKYKSKDRVDFRRGKPNQRIRVLDNEVDVLISDSPSASAATTQKQLLGVDYEFFIDGRESLQTASSGGLDVNLTYTPPFIISFFPWPTYSYGENRARTSVSNKIIVRSGIIEEVHAFDGQANLVTTNKVFDPKNGQSLYSTVENQFTGDIHNYSVPAYLAYDGMGAAAENWGHRLSFYVPNVPQNCTGYYPITPVLGETLDNCVPGDEFIVELQEPNNTTQAFETFAKARLIYMGDLYDDNGNSVPQVDILEDDALGLTSKAAQLKVVARNTRSGKRNLLGVSVAQYSTIDTDGTTGSASPLSNRGSASKQATLATINIDVPNHEAYLTLAVGGDNISQATLNNVLSTSGATFSEDWALDYYNYTVSVEEINPYISGKRGVWKSKSVHTYIDDRGQEALVADNNISDLRKSGVLNGVALFNWQDPFAEHIKGSNWKRTQDVSKYRLGGQAVESRDILGNYQAALYGYDDNLVTAQAANAKYYEVGYEGFEEWNIETTNDVLATLGYTNNGNIDIINYPSGNTTYEQQENYRLTYPMAKPVSSTGYILIKKPYVAHDLNIDKVNLLLSTKNESVRIEAEVTNHYPLRTGAAKYQNPGITNLIDEDTKGDYMVLELDFSNACNQAALVGSDWWAGEATLIYKRPIAGQDATEIVDHYAHTGKYSMLVSDALPGNFTNIKQRLLNLQDGKKYVFSAWIKVYNDTYPENVPVATYASRGITVKVNETVIPIVGPVIESWQKVEGSFVYDNSWTANNVNNYFNISIDQGLNTMYIDDIRVFPADGNMVSYVYDPIDYKLKASLDDNNYATFYIYDEAGNLISTKRETERGIKTIQETRNYIQPN